MNINIYANILIVVLDIKVIKIKILNLRIVAISVNY